MKCFAVVVLVIVAGGSVHADQVQLTPMKDNTLYQDPDGLWSNGAGQHLFAGRTAQVQNSVRRALLAFDVAGAIPPGATINSVTLRLNMSMTISGPQEMTLHRVVSNWGEGASDAFGNEGSGAPAEAGDATWRHTFFDTQFWGGPGGDFVAAPSAMAVVDQFGPYTWGSTSGMVGDVQGWLDNPAANFGWVLIGNEAVSVTAKRFDSRENPVPENRPVLIVDYTPGEVVVTPESFTRVRGLPVSGVLSDLFLSDDLRVVTRPDVFRTSAVPPVQIEVRGQSPIQSPAELLIRVESHASVNNIFQRLMAFNYDTSQYEVLNSRTLPTTDIVTDVIVAANPGRFIEDGTGNMRVLLQYNALAFTIAPIWQARQDQVIWRVRN